MKISTEKHYYGNDIDFFQSYLIKDLELIGIFAIGDKESEWTVIGLDGSETKRKGFNAQESWGNEYSWDLKMLGRGSFRILNDIEEALQTLIQDGWAEVSPLAAKESLK